jgi:phosphoribosylanthranilate isomerase
MKNVRIKICCISSLSEAETAWKHNIDAVGLVGNMPSGPGVISDDLIKMISNAAPPSVSTFLLTSETTSEKIIQHQKKVGASTIQIVYKIVAGTFQEIRNECSGIKLVQVIHVIDETSLEEALSYTNYADALLLDSGNPNLSIKELGGTGRIHNWEISREICSKSTIPVFLAGGLNPQNVKAAIEFVKPFGVDVCSGVRSNGKLDESKLIQFINEVKS